MECACELIKDFCKISIPLAHRKTDGEGLLQG